MLVVVIIGEYYGFASHGVTFIYPVLPWVSKNTKLSQSITLWLRFYWIAGLNNKRQYDNTTIKLFSSDCSDQMRSINAYSFLYSSTAQVQLNLFYSTLSYERHNKKCKCCGWRVFLCGSLVTTCGGFLQCAVHIPRQEQKGTRAMCGHNLIALPIGSSLKYITSTRRFSRGWWISIAVINLLRLWAESIILMIKIYITFCSLLHRNSTTPCLWNKFQ